MICLLARADTGLASIPKIVVHDERLASTLLDASRLDGRSETRFAVTRAECFANPLRAEVLPG